MTVADLFGTPEGEKATRIEWGQKSTHDHVLTGRKGTVRLAPSEQAARGYDGAHYPGGPKVFVPVQRVVITYTSGWEEVCDDRH